MSNVQTDLSGGATGLWSVPNGHGETPSPRSSPLLRTDIKKQKTQQHQTMLGQLFLLEVGGVFWFRQVCIFWRVRKREAKGQRGCASFLLLII